MYCNIFGPPDYYILYDRDIMVNEKLEIIKLPVYMYMIYAVNKEIGNSLFS